MTAILYLHNKTGISGGEQSLLNLWRNLDVARFTPVLVLPGAGPFADEARKNGVRVILCPVPKIRPTNGFAIIKTIRSLIALCRMNRIGLIHSYTPRNNLVAWAAGGIAGIPVIWHERNIPYGKERDITRFFLPLPDCVICNSRAVADRFMKNGALRSTVKVVLNGVDCAIFRSTAPHPSLVESWNPQHNKIVGLISNLSIRKGAGLFIDIAVRVLLKYPDIRFLIVGGAFGDSADDGKADIEARIERANLRSHLSITGFVSNVHEFIPLFDIGVAVTEKEACSRAILEIMACGKPVIAFATGGNPELIDHPVTGLLYPYGDTVSFANGIAELLDDSKRAARMGAAARKRVETHFAVAVNAATTMALYTHLLERKPA